MLLARDFPFFDIDRTFEEMDRLFGAFGRPLGLRSVPRGTFPAINLYNNQDSTVLTAEIPGVEAGDMELNVTSDSVTLKAQRKEPSTKDEHYYRKERPYGTFTRTLTLSEPVDPDSAKAEYKDGILKVTMVKSGKGKAKRIEIISN